MANVSSLKGVRTRYRNTLEKELKNVQDILKTDVSTVGLSEALNKINHSKCLLKTYSEKLTKQMEKLTEILSVVDDDPNTVDAIIEADCDLNLSVEHGLIELEHFKEKLSPKIEKVESISESSHTKKLINMQEQMNKLMKEQMGQHSDLLKSIETKDKTEHPSVKLPKLELNMFYGNKLQWFEFWDVFDCTVHQNKKLSNVEKFTYLLSKLGSEAKRAVSGFARTESNYEVVLQILRERYGNKQEIVDLHYKELMNTPSPSNKVPALRDFQSATEKHLRSLEVLGENVDQHVFISMIRTKLPEDVLRQLEFNKGANTEWTLRKLRKELEDYIVACERAGKRNSDYPVNNKSSSAFRSNTSHGNSVPSSIHNRFQKTYPETPNRLISSSESLFASAKHKPNQNASRSPLSPKLCRFCEKNHWSDECPEYTSLEDRKKRIKGCCYRCLKKGHMAGDCKSTKACVYCGELNKHHRSLCPRKFKSKVTVETTAVSLPEKEECEEGSSSSGENAMVSVGEYVFMQTATTEVKHPTRDNAVSTRILLDCGSQRTYVSRSLADKLELKPEKVEELKVVTFGSSQSKVIKTHLTTVCLKLKDGQFMKIKANIVPVISGHIQRKTLDISSMSELEYLVKSVELADTMPSTAEDTNVDLLLGNDYYLDMVMSQKMEVLPGLYLLSSKLGWILAGRVVSEENEEMHVPNMLIMTYGTNISKTNVFQSIENQEKPVCDLQNFWDMESIGIKDTGARSDDDMAMESFKESIKFEDGRYFVTWPWKEKEPDLPNNRELAYGRLKSCVKKLQSKPELLQKYDAVIQDQLQKGVIEKVNQGTSDGLEHYIPHHAVVNLQKANTKVRIVYDASAKLTKESNSLNECLYRGPVLLNDLCGLLMRFRLHRIAIVSDIEKAFLQVGLQPSERDATRFFWVKDISDPRTTSDNIVVMRFCRVPFGVISSPFLLAATVEAHLDTYETDIAKRIKSDLYVDNLITGVDTVEEGVVLYQKAKNIFKEASMNLREWISNSTRVNEIIPTADRAEPKDMTVLGYTWDHRMDTLNVKQQVINETKCPPTKRIILKRLASVFDPMGLFSPVVMKGKALLQELWLKKLNWDDPILEQTVIEVWSNIERELLAIPTFKVQRYIGKEEGLDVAYSIVCFSDASKKAYAAAVYLHQENNSDSKCDLLFSKTRIAPVKEVTIPRLELMAILIGVRCIQYVKEHLQLNIANTYLWSDSQVALSWINSEKTLPVFVKNRVSEIKRHSEINLGYVNTRENPADVATKGAKASLLYENTLWWHGPEWLQKPKHEWEILSQQSSCLITEAQEECEDISPIINTTEQVKSAENPNQHAPLEIDCERFSSITKLLRVTSLCLKFIKKLRRQAVSSRLTSDNINDSEMMWIAFVQKKAFVTELNKLKQGQPSNLQNQLGIYIDSEGLIRCKGRLDNSSLEEGARRPILLPKGERFTSLLIEKIHKQQLHSGVSQTLAGVRYKYWITHGRSAVKTVLKKCSVCRRNEGGPYRMPPMAPLPKSRVRESCPFSKTGVDYFGPLLIKSENGPKKVWISLFTCMVTRGVHLELIQDMTTEEFLLAFQRFIAQRGKPDEVVSDNAAHFKLASKTLELIWSTLIQSDEVQSYVASSGINWHFIVELAPWMGGFHERLVGIVKRSMRKVIGRKMLTLMQAQTLIKEVEAVVNSRPLVYIDEDINSTIALTPSHFLTPNPKIGIPETENESDNDYTPKDSACDRLLRTWKKGQKLLNEFWRIWREQYLTSLRERTQSSLKAGRVLSHDVPKCGDVVLIKDNVPRGAWKIGKLIGLKESKDKVIRSAKVQLPSKKVLNRPLSLLYPLECGNEEQESCSEDCRSNMSSGAKPIGANLPHRKARDVAKQRIKTAAL